METSAATSANVKESFLECACAILSKIESGTSTDSSSERLIALFRSQVELIPTESIPAFSVADRLLLIARAMISTPIPLPTVCQTHQRAVHHVRHDRSLVISLSRWRRSTYIFVFFSHFFALSSSARNWIESLLAGKPSRHVASLSWSTRSKNIPISFLLHDSFVLLSVLLLLMWLLLSAWCAADVRNDELNESYFYPSLQSHRDHYRVYQADV